MTSVRELRVFPVKSMGGQACTALDVTTSGVAGDRSWAVYDAAGRLASGKHSRRFRRMDPVFELTARREGDETLVLLPDGREVVAGSALCDEVLSAHFGEPVRAMQEHGTAHQDAAPFSLVGTATLAELGRHEGDGRPVDARHVRANVVVTTSEPYEEESWVGGQVEVGGAVLAVTATTERCRMVTVAQVDLAARPDLLRVVSERHDLVAGVYADVARPGRVAVGDVLRPG